MSPNIVVTVVSKISEYMINFTWSSVILFADDTSLITFGNELGNLLKKTNHRYLLFFTWLVFLCSSSLIILNNPANYISNKGIIDIRTDNPPPPRGILQKHVHRSKPTSLPRSRFRGALRDETTNPLASRSTPSQRRPLLYCNSVTFILPKLLLRFKYY